MRLASRNARSEWCFATKTTLPWLAALGVLGSAPTLFAAPEPPDAEGSADGASGETNDVSAPTGDGRASGEPGEAADGDPAGLPEGLTLPELKTPVNVEYPASLRREPEPPAGVVKVRVVVMTDGSVGEASIVSSVHPDIDAAVLARLREAVYEPARFKGEPVELAMTLDIDVPAPALEQPESEPESEPEPEPETQPEPEASGPVRIAGTILKGGDRAPVGEVQVLALPAGDLEVGKVPRRTQRELAKQTDEPAWMAAATTDETGAFALRGVPDGKVRLVFVAAGYERFERVVELPPGEAIDGKFYLVEAHDSAYRTTVEVPRRDLADLTRRKLTAEELAVMPGTGGDALKGIQNLPGVARAPFGFGDILLRGAGPGDSIAYIGHHEVPLAFHFFGLTSVIPTSMLESVDVIPSSYDARYGDAIGGVVDVRFRKGRTDRVHGEVFADVIQAGAMLEAPIGKGWIMAGARRSYVGNVLAAFQPSFTVAPRYWDYQGMFGYPLGPGELIVRGFGSDDTLEGVGDDVDDAFDLQIGFHRADIEYSGTKGDWSWILTPGYRRIGQAARFSADDTIDLTVDSGVWRAEATWAPKRWVSWQFGTQGDASSYGLDLLTIPFGQDNFGESVRSKRRGTLVTAAGYSSVTFTTRAGFSVTPGVRVNGFLAPNPTVIADPRLRAKWRFGRGTTLKAGGGTYSQVAAPEFWIEDFGNPDLLPERAWHVSAGIEQELPYDFTVEATGFYRQSWDLAMPSDALREVDGELERVNAENTGAGRAYGGELMVKRDFARNISGWVAYTIMRSELRERPGEAFKLADWDQTHNLVVMGHYRLPRNWSIGLRFRLVSGNLHTPISDGVVDGLSGDVVPIRGGQNSERLPLFHQLDVRVDKSWTVRAVKIATYLDIQNVYWAKNTEFVQYGFDFKESVGVQGLPLLPSLGVKVSF